MVSLDDEARAMAERHGLLDPDEFIRRVRAQLARRRARGAQPWKACPDCEEVLPALAFAEAVGRPDGLQRVCKACDAKRAKKARASSPLGG